MPTTPPPATDHANSFQAVALRVTKLDAAGVPVPLSGSSWITNQFISVGFTPNYQAGSDIAQLAADGSLCADYRTPDVLRNVNLSIAICNPEPELRALIGGGTLLTPALPAGGPVTGYAAPLPGSVPNPNGISIEVWSRAIVNGKPAATLPFWAWVFPLAHMWPTGETILENGLPAQAFTGYGYGNPSWAGGIDAVWPFPTDRAYQFARAAAVPTITNTWNLGTVEEFSSTDAGAPTGEVLTVPEGGTAADVVAPDESANKSEWVKYAVQRGMPEDEASTSTKNELIKLYGGQTAE